MVVRLLVALLVLVGPLPGHICTCAHGAAIPATDEIVVRPAEPSPPHHCGCRHCHETDDQGRAPEHEPDCPALHLASGPDTVPVERDGATAPLGTLRAALPPEPLAEVPAPAPRPFDRAPARPLFITLLTLRN